MSGRAGRDGKPAFIHLLFNAEDANINRRLLASLAPPRLALAALYQVLRKVSAGEGDGFRITNKDLAELTNDHLRANGAFKKEGSALPLQPITDDTVSSGMGIFRELGFLTTTGHSSARAITLNPTPGKVELQTSVRYLEGRDEQEDFENFQCWALSASADELLTRFNRPILPED
jgi:single-stranded-DNA-specific exonuclease